jgi:hypothetical protein
VLPLVTVSVSLMEREYDTVVEFTLPELVPEVLRVMEEGMLTVAADGDRDVVGVSVAISVRVDECDGVGVGGGVIVTDALMFTVAEPSADTLRVRISETVLVKEAEGVLQTQNVDVVVRDSVMVDDVLEDVLGVGVGGGVMVHVVEEEPEVDSVTASVRVYASDTVGDGDGDEVFVSTGDCELVGIVELVRD